jgi:hypothetical protein
MPPLSPADPAARRAARLARRREQAARRRLDPAYVLKQRIYQRNYQREHREAISVSHAKYQASDKGRAARARREAVARRQVQLNKLADKFATYQQNHTDMKNTAPIVSPPKSVSRGRRAWLVQFAKEHHVTLPELRRISKLLAAKREAERGLAEIEANINAREAAAAAAAESTSPKE